MEEFGTSPLPISPPDDKKSSRAFVSEIIFLILLSITSAIYLIMNALFFRFCWQINRAFDSCSRSQYLQRAHVLEKRENEAKAAVSPSLTEEIDTVTELRPYQSGIGLVTRGNFGEGRTGLKRPPWDYTRGRATKPLAPVVTVAKYRSALDHEDSNGSQDARFVANKSGSI